MRGEDPQPAPTLLPRRKSKVPRRSGVRFSTFAGGRLIAVSCRPLRLGPHQHVAIRAVIDGRCHMPARRLGLVVVVSANDLVSLSMGRELQSVARYVVAAFHRDSLRWT